jgi:hypothetical protein
MPWSLYSHVSLLLCPYAETNAAVAKPVTASALADNRGGDSSTLQSLVDNNVSSCVIIQADGSSPNNAGKLNVDRHAIDLQLATHCA